MPGILLTIVKALATFSSILMNLSPAPSMYEIHRSKSCGDIQVLPLLSLWGACHIWMMYGILSKNIVPIFATYVIGTLLAIGYLIVYMWYTSERRHVLKMLSGLVLWNALTVMFGYSGTEHLGVTSMSEKQSSDWIGYLAATTSLLLYASPFATLARVIKTKSVTTIPIAMVLAGAFNNSLWLLYGFLSSDIVVILSNVFCVLFGFVQIVVYYAVVAHNTRNSRLRGHAAEENVAKHDVVSHSAIDLDRSTIAIAVTEDDTEGGNNAHAYQAVQTPRVSSLSSVRT